MYLSLVMGDGASLDKKRPQESRDIDDVISTRAVRVTTGIYRDQDNLEGRKKCVKKSQACMVSATMGCYNRPQRESRSVRRGAGGWCSGIADWQRLRD